MAYNSHGHTPAAWTTVFLIFAAFVVAGIAVIALNWPLFWLGGVGLLVLAGVVGKSMQMMGLGQHPRPVGHEEPAVAAEGTGG
jgi:hypothetical protein